MIRKCKITSPTLSILLLLSGLLLGACQKDDTGMQLVAEGFGGAKAAVDRYLCYWVDGESVRINGETRQVTVDGSTAYLSDVASAPVYRALYPDSLNSTAALTDDEVQVLIPRTYTYRESGGLQLLGVPMAGRGTDESQLVLQHLTAALTVEIKNLYGFTIEVDSVVVMSNLYQLCGEKEITLAAAISVDADKENVSAADKRVKVCFDDGTALRVLSGETRRVQVPVLPVGNDNRFTIRVGVHKVDDADVKHVFEKTQQDAQDSYALGRRQMGFAGVKFGSGFSVSGSKQVIISQGNLQYVPSTGVWSFHAHPYDLCETGPVDSTTRYYAAGSNPIDLFGYGTSGYNNMYPYMTSKTDTDYPPVSNFSKTEYDWGWHNRISNGGDATEVWYLLTHKQWDSIFTKRAVETTGINSNSPTRYTYATIDGTYKGIILFPDKYTHPTGTDPSCLSGATFNSKSDFTATLSLSDWKKMEGAGAVFLPAAGYRKNFGSKSIGCHNIIAPTTGMYWTSSYSISNSKPYCLQLPNTYSSIYITYTREFGLSVRLVRDL